MQATMIVAILFFTAAVPTEAVTPVQKVIEMLQGMLEKSKKEKHEEQVGYAGYKQWCDDTTVEKQKMIKEADQMIDMLHADIQKYDAEAEMTVEEIAKIDEDVSVWTGDMKAATKVREVEKADYMATHTDYTESVDALAEAINVLSQQTHDRKQADLIQIEKALSKVKGKELIPAESKKVIDSFLAEDPDAGLIAEQMSVTAPEANAYEFQSQGIIDMLEKLKDKFIDERTALEKEEQASRHAYEMLMQDLKAQVEEGEANRGTKSTSKAKALQGAADAKADLQDTTSTRDDDQKYLTDMTSTCEQKASDFGDRQQLRADEVAALEKAVEILSSGAVSGAAEKHLPTLLQKVQKATSLAQLRTTASGKNPSQMRVAAYLKDQANRLNSRILSALAIRADEDPFKKVKKLIKDLITKLLEEANEEAEHKGWCDKELSTNEQTRNEKSTAVETLHSEIDELSASIAKLTHQITELTQAVADLDSAVAEATKNREAEKAKNTETITDAQEAQTAVAQAVTVLKEFYAKAAESTALVQQPETFDTAYKGNQDQATGVIGMLEVIQSDFARLEAETKAGENQGQKEFDSFMSDSAVDKAQKSKDIEHKTDKKQNEEQAVQEKKTDLESTQKELDAALAYYEKLKPSCVDAGTSYEDRVSRRKEEIASLQEALKILNGEDIAF
jgi:prefoldin subunit 5